LAQRRIGDQYIYGQFTCTSPADRLSGHVRSRRSPWRRLVSSTFCTRALCGALFFLQSASIKDEDSAMVAQACRDGWLLRLVRASATFLGLPLLRGCNDVVRVLIAEATIACQNIASTVAIFKREILAVPIHNTRA
jgi:hypothetical protein